jgi:hypothetical protein
VSSTRAGVAVVTLLGVSVSATSVVLIGGLDLSSLTRALCIAVAVAAAGTTFAVASLRRALNLRVVFAASLVLLAVAVIEPPQQSHDMWTYAMNGRILAHYGDNPYTHAPADYPHDPLLPLVGAGWWHTKSLYGPAFTVVETAIMLVTGTAVLATRLSFQGIAALAVLAVMVLLARKTRDPVVVLLVGVNPLVAIEVVNVGRNDALVALLLLVAVLLAARHRAVLATFVLTVAALMKIPLLIALGGLLLWVWRQYGSRVATRAATAAGGAVVASYLVFGGLDAVRPVADASNRMSRASLWQLARGGAFPHLLGLQEAQPTARVVDTVGPLALVAVVVLGLLFICSRLDDPTPELATIAGVVAFLLAGGYVLASYAMWALPIAAWRARAGISRTVLVWSVLVTIAYQSVRALPSDAQNLIVWLMSTATIAFAATALVALAVTAVRRVAKVRTASVEPAAELVT